MRPAQAAYAHRCNDEGKKDVDSMTGIGGKFCEAQIVRHNRQTRTV